MAIDDRRQRLVARARGRVLDISADGGLNARFYRNVDEVVTVEPSQLAGEAFALHSFDTVVCTIVLCRVADVHGTLLRIAELLAPDGQLLVLEHVRATGLRGRLQDAVTPVWRRVAGGCRPDRDAIDLLRRNGFAVTDCDRFIVNGATPLQRRAVSAVAIRRVRHEEKSA
jgi:SAM-dependent methyltransferase